MARAKLHLVGKPELIRPMPPDEVLDAFGEPVFRAAPEIIAWARQVFIDDGAPLLNEEHRHLRFASIGALWTNVDNSRRGRSVVGQCEMGLPPGGKWQRGRIKRQLLDWFGEEPDFLLTFDARYCAQCSDVAFAALVEHELLHCGQEKDEFGQPKFKKSGLPVFGLRGHDFEGFIGIAARYGIVESGVKELVEALKRKPLFSNEDVGVVCGTCVQRAA